MTDFITLTGVFCILLAIAGYVARRPHSVTIDVSMCVLSVLLVAVSTGMLAATKFVQLPGPYLATVLVMVFATWCATLAGIYVTFSAVFGWDADDDEV